VKFFLYDFAKAEIWYVDEDKRVDQSEFRLPTQSVCKRILGSFEVAHLVGIHLYDGAKAEIQYNVSLLPKQPKNTCLSTRSLC